MDVLLAYHFRLVNTAYSLLYARALAFIQQRDEAERKLWADRHRSGQGSLGTIVKSLFDARELHWDACTLPPIPKPVAPRDVPKPRGAERGKLPTQGDPSSKKFAPALKDGTRLCKDYNMGKCHAQCPKQLRHACNHYLKACGPEKKHFGFRESVVPQTNFSGKVGLAARGMVTLEQVWLQPSGSSVPPVCF